MDMDKRNLSGFLVTFMELTRHNINPEILGIIPNEEFQQYFS